MEVTESMCDACGLPRRYCSKREAVKNGGWRVAEIGSLLLEAKENKYFTIQNILERRGLTEKAYVEILEIVRG
jgi:hypothetical protein